MAEETLTEVVPSPPTSGSKPAPEGGLETWWSRYERHGLAHLTESARKVLTDDCKMIVESCVVDPAVKDGWGTTRVRTGMVVGGVQSGKTASMLGISALLLDGGLDILLILAGTRLALWMQTFERMLSQLDGSTAETADDRFAQRLIIPDPYALLRGTDRSRPTEYMASAGTRIDKALRKRRPIIIVVPKVPTHLLAVSRKLHERLVKSEKHLDRNLHMVVFDDEADDASVLDALDAKTVPRRIEMLWSSRGRTSTAHERLYATYVAYTATPQANFLQQAQNPLAPRDFCVALRAPFVDGPLGTPRSPTFAEPEGIRRFYCGGEFFYKVTRPNTEGALCQTLPYPNREDAVDDVEHASRVRASSDELLRWGLEAYLVGGALRLMAAINDNDSLRPSQLAGGISTEDLPRLPPTHSMLVHPSSRQDLHTAEARRLVAISRGADPDNPDVVTTTDESDLALDSSALIDAVRKEPQRWLSYIDSFRRTILAFGTLPGASELPFPDPKQRSDLLDLLCEEVIPHARIRIINSDPMADDRPRFAPQPRADGRFDAPPDLFTIFVAGNVMSRGITIEGLSSSVFTRPANEPAADTQMQMQRWFGYRGSHAHVCRLFTFADQLELFATYHEHDTALRKEIMSEESEPGHRLVLQGPRSLATAKLPTRRVPLHPGPTPSIKLIEADDADLVEHNIALVISLRAAGNWVNIGPEGRPRGVLRTDPIDLATAAEILDGLRYASYDPSPTADRVYSRWASLARQLRLTDEEAPLFRPPGLIEADFRVDVRSCPYSIAAYLRLWAAALKRVRCDGLYASDAEGTPWSLSQPELPTPRFYVGIAYGAEGLAQDPRLAADGVQAMKRGEVGGAPRLLNTLWGRRGVSGHYYGDQLFDYNHTGFDFPPIPAGHPLWRPRGHPGLLLFHVIRPGEDSVGDAVAVGLALPHGGPEHFASFPAMGAVK